MFGLVLGLILVLLALLALGYPGVLARRPGPALLTLLPLDGSLDHLDEFGPAIAILDLSRLDLRAPLSKRLLT